MLCGSVIVTAYFVTDCTMGTISTSCTPTCRTPSGVPSAWYIRSARFTWPEMKRHGVESSQAPTSPVMALVAPGPVVTSATPRWFVPLE